MYNLDANCFHKQFLCIQSFSVPDQVPNILYILFFINCILLIFAMFHNLYWNESPVLTSLTTVMIVTFPVYLRLKRSQQNILNTFI